MESRVHPDTHRGEGNQARWNTSPDFVKLHRNKKSVTINLGKPEGRELARELVRLCDVVVENFTLRVMKRWGLGYPNLRRVRPDLVMISLRGLGSTGPDAEYATYGPNLTPLFGLSYLWNDARSGTPTGEVRAQHPDFMSGVCGAFAVMAALSHRAVTGQGQWIDGAQVEVGAALLGPSYLEYIVNGTDPVPQGNRCLWATPHGAYRCQGEDRWCVIAVETDTQWEGLCRALANPQWARDHKFLTFLGRAAHREELDAHLERWTSQHTAHWVMEALQREGVPAAAVQDVEDLFQRDPQLQARGGLVEIVEPELGPVVTEGLPVHLSETPGSLRTHAPLMGEHTRETCRDLLGLPEGDVRRLELDGVLE